MEFITKDAPANFNLFLFGDVHAGTLLHYESGLDKLIDMMNSPYRGCGNNRAVGMGDYMEAIDHTDRRFDVDTVDMNKIRPDMQREYIEEKLRPIKRRIDVLQYGNHEHALLKYHDYVRSMCRNLNIPYGTYTSIVTYRRKGAKGDETHMFKLYATHGNGQVSTIADDPERQEANLNLSLKRRLKNKSADCAVMAMGHTHKLLVVRPKKTLYMTSNGKELEQNYTESNQNDHYIHPDMRWYLNTGSFLRTYMQGVSGYAERACYDPAVLGFPVVMVRDCKIVDCEKVFI